MEERIMINITGMDGSALPEYLLRTLYASDINLEPHKRRSRITPDGAVELVVDRLPFMLHARMDIPLYGNIWVMAHNRGEGYRCHSVDFVREAVETYLWEAKRRLSPGGHSTATLAHLEAAEEFHSLADRGEQVPYCRMMALSHAVLAAEGICVESARRRLAESPRPDMLLGCNTWGYKPGSRYNEYFTQLFNFATLPFYTYKVAAHEGSFDYGEQDGLVDWCESRGMVPKGHPLWFGHGETNPPWMFNKSYSELKTFARTHIKSAVSRYRGRIKVWDAINEPHDWANCFGFSQDQSLEFADLCCNSLRENDEEALSLINVCLPFGEYVAGGFVCYGPAFDKLISPLAFFRRAIERGIDFDGVGIQMYFPARDLVAVDRLLDQYRALGKPVHITEMGVPAGPWHGADDDWDRTSPQSQVGLTKGIWHAPWDEHIQADWMEQFYTMAAARGEIKALTWWDFSDPGFMKTSPFLYEDHIPREMFFRLRALRPRIFGTASSSQGPMKGKGV